MSKAQLRLWVDARGWMEEMFMRRCSWWVFMVCRNTWLQSRQWGPFGVCTGFFFKGKEEQKVEKRGKESNQGHRRGPGLRGLNVHVPLGHSLSTCWCVRVCVCLYVYVCVIVRVYACICECVKVSVRVSLWVRCVCDCVSVCMWMWVSVWMCVYDYVSVCNWH